MVGGNPPNHLGDFEKKLRLGPCFLGVNVGLECGMWKRGSRGSGRGRRIIRNLENEARKGKRYIYFVCDGRWLKYLSFLSCIVIVLNVRGKVDYVM